jgi:methylmalonyl-CoA/ethylmalonyl-CoA epimerase
VKIDLDHVAIGLHDVGPTLQTLVGEFGAPVLFGGANIGFRAMQVDCGGMRIELLEPHNTEMNDFLARFLERNGEGPHHMTFKTDDIEALIARVEGAGYSLVGVNLANPFWREAFIHPKQGGGTVQQIAQSSFEPLDFEQEVREYGPGKWWPDPPSRGENRAILKRVVVTTDEMSRALELYGDILGGERAGWDEGWVELEWPGGGHIRLEVAAGRPQGIDRLEWEHDGPRTEERVGGTTMVLYSSPSASS